MPSTEITFHASSKSQIESYTSVREGETKLGQQIQSSITPKTRIVILGICEDIGPRANHGNPGSQNAFDAFLHRFLNMQSNRFLNGNEITLLGSIHAESSSNDVEVLRDQVKELDKIVVDTLSNIDFSKNVDSRKTKHLVVIGGGHNNAYPIIKAIKTHVPSLHILNIDPHADCRPIEGRHSGNPFSTAISESLIESYTVFGLHQQYNSEAIYTFLEANKCDHTFFEEYLDGRELMTDLDTFIASKGTSFGVEIDLDAIERIPSSAFTPSGFSITTIRKALRKLSSHQPTYLHLPEGAPISEYDKKIVGKTLAYLVSDFIKKVTK